MLEKTKNHVSCCWITTFYFVPRINHHQGRKIKRLNKQTNKPKISTMVRDKNKRRRTIDKYFLPHSLTWHQTLLPKIDHWYCWEVFCPPLDSCWPARPEVPQYFPCNLEQNIIVRTFTRKSNSYHKPLCFSVSEFQ